MKLSTTPTTSDRAVALSVKIEHAIDLTQRCGEILDRLACVKSPEQLDANVLKFIDLYIPEAHISTEALIEVNNPAQGFFDTVKKICGAIKAAILKVWGYIYEILKTCFNAQYRHRKNLISCNRTLIGIAKDGETIRRFENTECTVIPRDKVELILDATLKTINLVRDCGAVNDEASIDALLGARLKECNIVVMDGKLSDTIVLDDLAASVNGSFANAGWTVTNLNSTVQKTMDCVSGIETIRDLQKQLEKEKSNFDKEITQAMHKNVCAETIQDLQRRAALKIKAGRILCHGLVLIINRTNFVNNFLDAVTKAAEKIADTKSTF